MSPLRPEASRASSHSSYVDASDDRHVQQAGRSNLNLNAAASAQSLREQARPASRPPSRSPSQPNLLQKKNRKTSSNLHSEQPLTPPPANTAAATLRPASPHAPLRASPLNIRHSNSSSEASSSNVHGEGIAGAGLLPAQSSLSLASSPQEQRPRMMIPGNGSSLSISSQPPRTLRDLGSDYTRYYNPFASQNNSQLDVSATPLLGRTNSSTHLMAGSMSPDELNRRLSNPFKDTNRMSNPFGSNNNTAPGTPIPMLNNSEKEKVATVGAAAVGAGAGGAAASEMVEKHGTPMLINEDPEKAVFFPYMDDRLGAPICEFPLYTDAVEDDDDMHMPAWDDDIKMKATWKEHFARGNLSSTIGMVFMVLGLLTVFIVLPVISFTGTNLIPYPNETPLDQMPGAWDKMDRNSWYFVNDRDYPLLKNIRTGLIDPDTPSDAMTRKDINGDTLNLVFSDEFNEKNRTFYPGDDPFWFAPDFWYGATMDLEWYDPDAVNTGDGVLSLQLDAFPNHGLQFRSGMLNSWNQLCFKGGVFEISASLPGPGGVHGLWPGAWTMGNLGRPGYLATTDGMWPYTYNDCDAGITPNQSQTDGLSYLPGQRLSSCGCKGSDHPTPGTGRGAPEIDIIEVSGDWAGMGVAVATQSFQVAPFDIYWYPNYDYMETPDYRFSFVNTYTGGPFQQAVSTTTMLNNSWYDGMQYQKYAFEYAPGAGEDAYIQWYVGDDEMMKFDARAIGPNGNVGQRLISEEPMSMVINLGISENWVNIDYAALKFPTIMRIDYVRIYQKEGEELMTCDPPGYETTQYIKDHPAAYNNPNFTHWEDAGYDWPKNTLMHGCEA